MWLELHLRRNLIHYKIEEMPITLKLPSHVKRIEKEGKILFFNPDVPSWLVTNSNGALLLSMCDGKASVTDIVAALSDTAGEKAAAQARRFFNEAIASHLFEEPLPGEVPVKQEYQELTSVQLSISDQCNLNCRYCYATDRKESVYPQLQMDDYRRLVDGIQEMSCNVEFTLTGGEPLLNPDVFNLARYIRRKGASVDVLTNGTLSDEGFLTTKGSTAISLLFTGDLPKEGQTLTLPVGSYSTKNATKNKIYNEEINGDYYSYVEIWETNGSESYVDYIKNGTLTVTNNGNNNFKLVADLDMYYLKDNQQVADGNVKCTYTGKLNLDNLNYFIRTIPWTDEVSIGHALISDALYLGLEKTIKAYLAEINKK